MSIYAQFYEPFFSFSEVDNLVDGGALKSHRNWRNTALERLNNENRVLRPRMDLHENPDANTITASFELPGLTKDNVTIDVHNSRLTVSGELSDAGERSEGGFIIKECRAGRFSRTVALPAGTQPDAIKASMENGILTVTFPKSSPGQEPHRINIS